jgi:hypothetical protein
MRIIDPDRERNRQLREEYRVLRKQMFQVIRGHVLRKGWTVEQALDAYQCAYPGQFNRMSDIHLRRTIYAMLLRRAREFGWTHIEPAKNDPAALQRAGFSGI